MGTVLVLAIVAAYASSLRGEFVWDDDLHITANPTIIGPLGLKEIWTTARANYFPLVLTNFWLQHALWDLNPMGYRIVTLAFHIGAALLLWRVLLRLRIPGAWLGAALWALHPVQVESVAWICELKNTQSGVFFLAAIWFWLRWTEVGVGRNLAVNTTTFHAAGSDVRPMDQPADGRHYFLALFCAVLALLSKPSTVTLPVALALCAWWRNRRLDRRTLIALVPFFALSALAAGWTIWEQKIHSGAAGPEWNQTLPERVVIAGRIVWFYLGKLIWPEPLIFIYPRWEIDSRQPLAYGAALAALAAFVLLWRARDGRMRAGFFAAAFFIALLFPVLGFFAVYFFRYSFVGDHFQYLASIGPLALIGAGIARLSRRGAMVAAIAALFALGGLTARHTATFRNMESLWRSTVVLNPECRMAWLNLGDTYSRQQRHAESIASYRRALEIAPNDAEGHNDLGCELTLTGHADEALPHLERAIQLKPEKAEHYSNRGNALRQLGRRAEAIASYEQALRMDPQNSAAHVNLGAEMAEAGRLADAVPHFESGVRGDPKNASARENLGRALMKLRRPAEAIPQFEAAVQLSPNSVGALVDLGSAYSVAERWPEAVATFERAARIDPANATIQARFGIALAKSGRVDEALAALQRAVDLDPNDAEAHQNLGVLLHDRGRIGEAADHLARAAELRSRLRP